MPNDEVSDPLETPTVGASLTGDETRAAVRRVDLSLKHGQLVAITGAMGSGKSSLLLGALGELRLVSGSVRHGETQRPTVGYCGQRPWLMHGTIRENILLGRPFEPQRYAEAIDACALSPDLTALPLGDATEVGDRGGVLSVSYTHLTLPTICSV